MTKTHNCRAKIPLSSHIEIMQNKMQEHYLFSIQTLPIFQRRGVAHSWLYVFLALVNLRKATPEIE